MWRSLFIKGPSPPGFLEITGHMSGSVIAGITGGGVEFCSSLCFNNIDCCSIEYSPSKKECKHYKECVPSDDDQFEDFILYHKGIWVNFFYLGKCKEKIPLLLLLFTESCFQNGQYNDYVLDSLVEIPSAQDCQKKCQEHPDCQFWTWNTYGNLGHCYLQSYDAALDTKSCDPSIICVRGPKFCQGR